MPALEAGTTLIKNGVRAQVLLTPERTGYGGVGLALIEIDVAREVPTHRHAASEFLFLLEGDGEIVAAAPTTVNAREGVWIPPDTAHGFRATANSRILALYVPSGPELRYLGKDDPGTTASGSDLGEARHPVRIFRPSTSEPLALPSNNGVVRVALEPEKVPGVAASCSLLELTAGASVPEHSHPGAAEILFVFEGEGTLRLDGREELVRAPAAVLVPPDVRHAFTVTSATPVRAVQFYSPPGPEQRFKTAK